MFNNLPIILLCAAMIVVVALGAFDSGKHYLANLRQPMTEASARIVSRRIQEDAGGGWTPAQAHFVTFATENGEWREFAVPEAEFAHLADGASGTLKFRGEWYQGFHA